MGVLLSRLLEIGRGWLDMPYSLVHSRPHALTAVAMDPTQYTARVDRDAHETLCIREKGRNSRLHGTETKAQLRPRWRRRASRLTHDSSPPRLLPLPSACVLPPCGDVGLELEPGVWSASSPRGGSSRRWQCDGGGGWARQPWTPCKPSTPPCNLLQALQKALRL